MPVYLSGKDLKRLFEAAERRALELNRRDRATGESNISDYPWSPYTILSRVAQKNGFPNAARFTADMVDKAIRQIQTFDRKKGEVPF